MRSLIYQFNNGLDNQYSIVQVNCEDNIIEGNSFHKSEIKINISEENPRDKVNESMVVDFTIVLLLSLSCTDLYVFAVKFRKKRISTLLKEKVIKG